ncbi:MAG: ribonuclease HI family protein [Acidobacteriota bacterium]
MVHLSNEKGARAVNDSPPLFSPYTHPLRRSGCSPALPYPPSRCRESITAVKHPEEIIEAWFDGSCWPNQGTGGHGAYGVVVKRLQQTIFSRSVYMGHGPQLASEVCEYAGIICVFRFLLQQGIETATIHGDSQMVIHQLDGLARAKARKVLAHYQEAKELRDQLPGVRLAWISRKSNAEANTLSRIRLVNVDTI